ncbi:MAG: 30S ribosomal protein S9 [candidate division Zixibacteria bacterium]|nr:30S ribosomal protein S9 [candidate division Zixibacteria bacterium]
MEQTTDKAIPGAFAATGRRKESVCRVNLKHGKGEFIINGKEKKAYLCRDSLIQHIMAPLELVELSDKIDVTASAKGGGLTGQAGAIRLAIARALLLLDPEFRAGLKKAGFLTVDARKVERKKYGQPKARKRFQFSKR